MTRFTFSVHTHLVKRKDSYYLRRRVPKRFRLVEPREFVHVSLKTDSRSEAEKKAKKVWDEYIAAWEAAMEGDKSLSRERFSKAKALAQKHGYQ